MKFRIEMENENGVTFVGEAVDLNDALGFLSESTIKSGTIDDVMEMKSHFAFVQGLCRALPEDYWGEMTEEDEESLRVLIAAHFYSGKNSEEMREKLEEGEGPEGL